MRYLLLALSMLLSVAASAATYVSIGINLPVYPELVRVPNYPVYYAPRVNANIFFYDGLYWAYTDDSWYASSWYNGPWEVVDPYSVPVYVLRVPVRYYRYRPAYFSAWAIDAPPRWGEHWGATWEQRRSGWDSWNRSSVPAAAPLPVYQRQYSGTRYPRVEQQQVIQTQQYRYQPRDTVARQYYRQQTVQTSVAPAQKRQQVTQSAASTQSSAQFAPGQVKNQQGAQSAKELAPGQVKKQQNAQSAKEFAPGQVRKQQAQTTAMAPVQPMNQQIAPAPRPNENARGQGKGKGKGNDEGEGQGRGEGQGQGHGKGHGKD